MIAVIQRVNHASVSVEGAVVGKCGYGLLIALGVFQGDTETDAELLFNKISKLRIFTDENDKLNLSVIDVSGSVLVISNFTLCARYRHGNRPDYTNAAAPDEAKRLYEYFASGLRNLIIGEVQTGCFGEHMEIEASLKGPVTIVMDSKVLAKKIDEQ